MWISDSGDCWRNCASAGDRIERVKLGISPILDRSKDAAGRHTLLCGVQPLQHVDAFGVIYFTRGR